MAFEDRDYAWDSPGRRDFLGDTGRAVKTLIAINVAVFVAQILTMRTPGPGPTQGFLTGWFGLEPSAVLHGQVWRLLSYAFLHSEGSLFHVLFNMLWLWGLGRPAENRLGTREFTFFYLASAVAGGLVFCGLELAFPSLGGAVTAAGEPVEVTCVGASGAVMGVILLVALWDPQRPINLILLTVPIWVIAGLYAVVETYEVLFQIGAGRGNPDGTAHGAHFGGLALAFLYHRFGWRFEDTADAVTDRLPRLPRVRRPSLGRLPKLTVKGTGPGRGPRRPGRGPALRVHDPGDDADGGGGDDPADDLDRRGDAVLAKLHATGEASLTDDERATLKLYSERAKERVRARRRGD